MKKCFNWNDLRPMYFKDNIIEGDKNDMRLYLLNEVKTNFFKIKCQRRIIRNFYK